MLKKKVLFIIAIFYGIVYSIRPWLGWYIFFITSNLHYMDEATKQLIDSIKNFSNMAILVIGPALITLYVILFLLSSFNSYASIINYALFPISFALLFSLLTICVPVSKGVYYPIYNWAYAFGAGNYFSRESLCLLIGGTFCLGKKFIKSRLER